MTPAGPGPSPWLRGRVAVLDRVVAAVAAVALSPVVAVVAAVVRARDGSPVLVRLTRVGRHRRPFPMLKVRTMTTGTAGAQAAGAPLTAGGDLRITSVGRWLRRHRLDELPQLANVVRGDMALVGARPEDPGLVDDDPLWDEVLAVPPAITGPTQLVVHAWEEEVMSGPGDHVARYRATVLPVKLAIDRWYVTQASPRIDVVVAWSMVERFVLHRPRTRIDALVRGAVPIVGPAIDGVAP